MKTLNFGAILDRLKEALNIGSDTELASVLGVKKATISNWRKRDTADLPLLFSICEHIDLNWLIFGEHLQSVQDDKHEAVPNSELLNRVIEQAEEIGRLKERLVQYEEGKNTVLAVHSDTEPIVLQQMDAVSMASESV